MIDFYFRGMKIENDQWEYGFYGRLPSPKLGAEDRHFIMKSTLNFANNRTNIYFTDYEVYKESVGMYVGLKGKNKEGIRKIFEGDIVKYFDNNLPVIKEVKMTPFGVNLPKWIFEKEEYLPEILGNKIDNPDLLSVVLNNEFDRWCDNENN